MVKKTTFLTLVFIAGATAEEHKLTLRQAVELALKQNPDLTLARLDEQKAHAAIAVSRDAFSPKVYGGSGLAYTSGFPSSIEGSSPSIFQLRTDMALYNRPQSYQVARARENARGAVIGSQAKAEEVAYQTADLFLNAVQEAQSVTSARMEVEILDRMHEGVQTLVGEGRELPVAEKQSALNTAKARQRAEVLQGDLDYSEESLAVVLGFPPGDRVKAAAGEASGGAAWSEHLPESEDEAVDRAMANSKEIQQLESQLVAKGFEVRAQKASRLPQIDVVAQYALFARYNYQDYFRTFQRNNGQLGVSIKIPLLVGSAPSGLAAQAETEIAKLRIQMGNTRGRVTVDAKKYYQDMKRAEGGRTVSKLDLEVAREQLSVLLAQLDEGRVPRSRVDEERYAEQEKWLAFYESEHALERARLNLLRRTGALQTALR